MKTLIVEDDFIGRRLLQSILARFGVCEVAINGLEAVEAFKMAAEEGNPYDLICLDIMMPEMDGQEVLKEIRRFENHIGVEDSKRAKIIMTTALDDFDNIKMAFNEKCDAYMIKPITTDKLLGTLNKVGIVILN